MSSAISVVSVLAMFDISLISARILIMYDKTTASNIPRMIAMIVVMKKKISAWIRLSV
jgi:hypothetical protein